MYESYCDEIALEYNNFLAEQELFNDLISLGSSVHHESVGLILISEDFKDTVNTYIEKIVTGIQKAWENFKDKVIQSPFKKFIDKIKKDQYLEYDGKLEVQYWHTYNFAKFENLKMVDFNLELLKTCEDKTSYYEKAFPGFMINKEKTLKENIIEQIINTEDTHVITKEEMMMMYTFCTKDFERLVNRLKEDISKINANISNLKNSINVAVSGAETTSTVSQQTTLKMKTPLQIESFIPTDELSALYESFILTEEEKDTKATTIVKNPEDDKEKAKEQKNNIKYMNWYLAGNTDVFSAKMKILRQRYLDYARIFKAVFTNKAKDEKETEGNKYKMKDQLKMKQPLKMKDKIEI